MEMQSILTQMTSLFSVNSQDNSANSSKTEGKGKVSFQDYMTGTTKQNDAPVERKQSASTELQPKTDAQPKPSNGMTEQKENVSETSEPIVMAKPESSKKEPVIQEGLVPQEFDNMDVRIDNFPIVQNVVHEWKEEVQGAICEEFELTSEDLEEIMAEIGVQLVDLQNLPNIQQFVLAVAGTDDKTDLLTNEMLANQVVLVEEIVEQVTMVLSEEYEMTDDEIIQCLSQDVQPEESEVFMDEKDGVPETEVYQPQSVRWKKEMPKEHLGNARTEKREIFSENKNDESTESVKDMKAVDEKLMRQKLVNEMPEEIQPENENVFAEESAIEIENAYTPKMEKNQTSLDGKNILTSLDSERAVKEIAEPNIEITVEKPVDKTEANFLENGKGEKQFTDSDKRQDTHNLFEHFVENLSLNRTNHLEQPQLKIDAVAQMREIVTQVVEQIKVRVNVDTTSMEIQLNPENLGKVNLTVVAKEGHLTAQLITENEMAKQALEGQIQQLGETLGEQGLKVDEVEVAVSNFDFSHSNQANAEEQRQQHGQEQKRLHRKLNLNEVINFDELNEEEQLAARIMVDNGNQVDYTA